MDLIEFKYLEEQGVFIHLSYDHYDNGTNCCFSIKFTKFNDKNNQTSWYGDNHEFGDTVGTIQAAIKIAKYLLQEDRVYWYFYNGMRHTKEEGNHKKYLEKRDEFEKWLCEEFPTYKETYVK